MIGRTNAADSSVNISEIKKMTDRLVRLSDFDTISISSDTSNPTIMPYDGFVHLTVAGTSGEGGGLNSNITLNGVSSSFDMRFPHYVGENRCSRFVPVRKGDELSISVSRGTFACQATFITRMEDLDDISLDELTKQYILNQFRLYPVENAPLASFTADYDGYVLLYTSASSAMQDGNKISITINGISNYGNDLVAAGGGQTVNLPFCWVPIRKGDNVVTTVTSGTVQRREVMYYKDRNYTDLSGWRKFVYKQCELDAFRSPTTPGQNLTAPYDGFIHLINAGVSNTGAGGYTTSIVGKNTGSTMTDSSWLNSSDYARKHFGNVIPVKKGDVIRGARYGECWFKNRDYSLR